MQDPNPADPNSSTATPAAPPTGSRIVRPYPLPELRPGEFYVEPIDPATITGQSIYCIEVDDPFDHFVYRVKSIVCSAQTPFQHVVIADTYNYGLALFIDGKIQSSFDDEALYHEMLVQPAMLLHPNPRSVLIVGGGEGATLREVLAHNLVRSVTMVDIDQQAVELCRQFLPSWSRGAYEDSRTRVVYTDGRKFIEETDELYDVVIIDVVDMLADGPAFKLYTREFYRHLRKRLRPDAIVTIQGLEFSHSSFKQHVALVRTLRTLFPEVHSARVAVPSFLGTWGIIMASDWVTPRNMRAETIDHLVEQRLGHDWLDHVNGEFVIASYAHCKETRYVLSQPGPILEDDVLFIQPPDAEDIDPTRAKLPALDAP
jgi:spermidine synthase